MTGKGTKKKNQAVTAYIFEQQEIISKAETKGLYVELRRQSMFRNQLNEDRIRNLNRLHREMKIYFPEYKDAYGKVDGTFCL